MKQGRLARPMTGFLAFVFVLNAIILTMGSVITAKVSKLNPQRSFYNHDRDFHHHMVQLGFFLCFMPGIMVLLSLFELVAFTISKVSGMRLVLSSAGGFAIWTLAFGLWLKGVLYQARNEWGDLYRFLARGISPLWSNGPYQTFYAMPWMALLAMIAYAGLCGFSLFIYLDYYLVKGSGMIRDRDEEGLASRAAPMGHDPLVEDARESA